MKYIIFIVLAIIEHLIITLLTKGITHFQYEYISIRYETLKLTENQEKYCGLNILIKLFFPLIYMIIISGIYYNTGNNQQVKNIYIITIFYYLIRWIDIVFILNRRELHDWKSEIITCIIGVTLNVFIYNFFICKTTQIFISIDQLRDGIWIGIITFAFIVIRNLIYKYAYTDPIKLKMRKEKYILKKYELYKNKYDQLINEENKEINSIVYGIMIYENFNRPAIYRILEYLKCTIKGEATLGIMQVKTRVWISNKTSVKKGYKRIKDTYEKEIKERKENNCSEKEIINKVNSTYNKGKNYPEEVLYIISVIRNEIRC